MSLIFIKENIFILNFPIFRILCMSWFGIVKPEQKQSFMKEILWYQLISLFLLHCISSIRNEHSSFLFQRKSLKYNKYFKKFLSPLKSIFPFRKPPSHENFVHKETSNILDTSTSFLKILFTTTLIILTNSLTVFFFLAIFKSWQFSSKDNLRKRSERCISLSPSQLYSALIFNNQIIPSINSLDLLKILIWPLYIQFIPNLYMIKTHYFLSSFQAKISLCYWQRLSTDL